MESITQKAKLMGRSQMRFATDAACKVGKITCKGGKVTGASLQQDTKSSAAKTGSAWNKGAALLVVVEPSEPGASVEVTVDRTGASAAASKATTKKRAAKKRAAKKTAGK